MKLNLKQLLREAELNDHAKLFVDTFAQVPEGHMAHPEAVKVTQHLPFNEHHQYIIPVSNTQGDVHKVLTDNGFSEPDYVAGTAKDKHNRPTKITRILAKHAPHLVEPFNTRDKNQWGENQLRGHDGGSPYDIVLSRHKYDIGGMSTQKKWESCQTIRADSINSENRYPMGNNLKVHGDIRSGSIVAYVMPKEHASQRPDPSSKIDVDHAVARMTMKPYYEAEEKTSGGYSNSFERKAGGTKILRPSRLYGDRNETFRNDLTEWSRKNFPVEPGKMYRQEKDVYNDGEEMTLMGPAPKNWEPTPDNKSYAMRILQSPEADPNHAEKIFKMWPVESATHMHTWQRHADPKIKDRMQNMVAEHLQTNVLNEHGDTKLGTTVNRYAGDAARSLAANLMHYATKSEHVVLGAKVNPEYTDNFTYAKPANLSDEDARGLVKHFADRLHAYHTDENARKEIDQQRASAGFRYMHRYLNKHGIDGGGLLDGMENHPDGTIQQHVAQYGSAEQKLAMSKNPKIGYDTALTLIKGLEEHPEQRSQTIDNVLKAWKPKPGDEKIPSTAGYDNVHTEKHANMYSFVRYARDYIGGYSDKKEVRQEIYDKTYPQFDKNSHFYHDQFLYHLGHYSNNPEHHNQIINLPVTRENGDSNMYNMGAVLRSDNPNAEKHVVHYLRRAQNDPEFAKHAERHGLFDRAPYALNHGSPLIPFVARHVTDNYMYDHIADKTRGHDKLAIAAIHASKDPLYLARKVRAYHDENSEAYKFANALRDWAAKETVRRDWQDHKERMLQRGPVNDPEYYRKDESFIRSRLNKILLSESQFGLDYQHKEFIDNHTDDSVPEYPQSEHDLYNATRYAQSWARHNVDQARSFATRWKTTGADNQVVKYTSHVPFNQHHQLIIPLTSERDEVEKHIGEQGWRIHDYDAGLAARDIELKDGPMKGQLKTQTKNISRLIKDPKLLERFNTRVKMGDYGDTAEHGHSIVISRHKYDVGGMSTNKNWSSCQNLDDYTLDDPKGDDLDGGNLHIQHEMNAGTHVAYLMPNEHVDHTGKKAVDTSHAIARIALRPYYPMVPKKTRWGDTNFEADEKAKPVFPLSRVYSDSNRAGSGAETFKSELKAKYLDKYHPMQDDTVYQMHKNVYPDIEETLVGKITPNVDPKGIPEWTARQIINNPDKHKLAEPTIIKFSETYPNLTSDIIRSRLKEAPNFQQKLWDKFKENPSGTHAGTRDALAYSVTDKDKIDYVSNNVQNYSHLQHLLANPNATLQQGVQAYRSYMGKTNPDGQYDSDYYKQHAANRLIEKAATVKETDPKGAKAVFDEFVNHPAITVRREMARHGFDEHLDKLMDSGDSDVRQMVLSRGRPQDIERVFKTYDRQVWRHQLENAGYYHAHTGAKQGVFDAAFNTLNNPNIHIAERDRINHLYTIAQFSNNPAHAEALAKIPNVSIHSALVHNQHVNLDDSHFRNMIPSEGPPSMKRPEPNNNGDLFTDNYGRRRHFGDAPIDTPKRTGMEHAENFWSAGGAGYGVRQHIINHAATSVETIAHIARQEPSSALRAQVGAKALGLEGTYVAQKFDDASKKLLQHALVSNPHFSPEDRRSLPWHVQSGIYSGDDYMKKFDPEVQKGYEHIANNRNVRDRLRAIYAARDLLKKPE